MTEPTNFPPRRRVDDTDDAGRRLDAREMDQLAKDARDILGKAATSHSLPRAELSATNIVRPAPPVSFEADRLDHLGRMSAEAVTAQYEEAATAFEAMGRDAKERVASIAGSLIELDKDLKTIAEMAAAIRDKGHRVKLQIEEASALSADIRAAANEVTRKLKP